MNSKYNLFDEISTHLPSTTIRSLNKNYNKMDNEYCKKAAFIYKDDMSYTRTLQFNIMYYYNDQYNIQASVNMENNNYIYKFYDKNDTVVLSIKHGKYDEFNDIIDIDILSKYKILKNRGCEDYIPFYSKDNTIKLLLKTFLNNLNPDNIHDIMYLYMYLHSNLIYMGYSQPMNKIILKVNQLPDQSFMDEIYNMYNLIHVHLKLMEL